jgi:hypothetical protein
MLKTDYMSLKLFTRFSFPEIPDDFGQKCPADFDQGSICIPKGDEGA